MRTKASVRIRWQPTGHALASRGKYGHDIDADRMHANRASARERPMTAKQDDTIAELQRTIAELRRERDAALAQRNSEYGERIEQQAATIEVLKSMSATAGDVQPVLDLIARRARELCDAETVGIFSFDGEMMSVRCVDAIDMRSLDPYLRLFPALRPAITPSGALFSTGKLSKSTTLTPMPI